MDIDQVVVLGRLMLQEVVILAGPVLAVAIVVSLAVNIIQVLTSMQDQTVATPRFRNSRGSPSHSTVRPCPCPPRGVRVLYRLVPHPLSETFAGTIW